MKVLVEEVAAEVGEKAALMMSQLHFWKTIGYGTEDGYVWNSYDEWRSKENFPWWGKNTIRRVLRKLENLEIVFKRKHSTDRRVHSWDQRREWALNYSHPLVVTMCSKWALASAQNGHLHLPKMDRSYNTNTTKENRQIPTPVGTTHNHSNKEPYQRTTRGERKLKDLKDSTASKKNYKKNWELVENWIKEKPQDFKDQLEKYIESEVNNPKRKVDYPIQYGMGVMHKVWHDETQGSHYSNFEYIDKTDLHRRDHASVVETRTVSHEERMGASMTPDQEMELLLSRGDIDYG